MEVARRFIGEYPGGSEAYLRLQLALMQHYVARGGTAEAFCDRLAPVFRKRWGPVLLGDIRMEEIELRVDRAA